MFFKKKEVIINNSSTFDIQKYLDEAIAYGKDFKFKFNFTNESILSLDKLLLIYNKDLEIERPTEAVIQKMGIIFGIYMGEVIRRNWLFDYIWEDSTDFNYEHPILVKKQDNDVLFSVDPVNECYHRILNGVKYNDINEYFIQIQKKAIKHDL